MRVTLTFRKKLYKFCHRKLKETKSKKIAKTKILVKLCLKNVLVLRRRKIDAKILQWKLILVIRNYL